MSDEKHTEDVKIKIKFTNNGMNEKHNGEQKLNQEYKDEAE